MTLRFIRTDINLMPLEHSALGGFIFNKRFLKKLFKAGVERKKLRRSFTSFKIHFDFYSKN